MITLSRLRQGVVLLVVALLVLAAVVALRSASTQSVTAYFTETKGIYVGDDVTVLGVPVGTVAEITPEPDRVKVELEIDGDTKIPAEARAAIVTKSLVSVRSIVIGPAYDGGEVLADGGEIPVSRTTVPVEFDEVKDELVRLTEALGPQGANSGGAASDLLSATATFLDGRGTDIQTTIQNLSVASQTLADNQGNLFGTVRNLDVFATALEDSDQLVRDFETSIANASTVLAQNGTDISRALDEFASLTTTTKAFFENNGEALAETLTSLQSTTSVLAENRQSIADLLQVAPTALSNLGNIFDPRVPAITGELGISNFGDPAYLICGGLFALGGSPTDCQAAIAPVAQLLKLSAPPVGVNPLSNSSVGPEGAVPAELAEQQGDTPVYISPTRYESFQSKARAADSDVVGQIDQMLRENQ